MKNKKIIYIITVIVISIIVFLLIIKTDKGKKYYTDEIQRQFISSYQDLNIRILDFVDVNSFFGIDINEIEECTFMGNMSTNDEINKDMLFVVVINSKNSQYYYDVLYSYIESNLLHIEDIEILELFNNAIIKKGKDYTYMIINKEAKNIEKEINLFYKSVK